MIVLNSCDAKNTFSESEPRVSFPGEDKTYILSLHLSILKASYYRAWDGYLRTMLDYTAYLAENILSDGMIVSGRRNFFQLFNGLRRSPIDP